MFQEIKPFVQTALDGMNVCLFAYGQTGSGKTFTMEGQTAGGDLNTEQSLLIDPVTQKPTKVAGILPRTALFLQSEIKRYEANLGKKIQFEVSALEIYCENIRDLLSQNENQYLELKSNGSQIFCPGQIWVPIDSPQQFLDQIHISQRKRIFKNNGVNKTSSRSHHVFQIKIFTYDRSGKACESFLNIVDLAGSERRAQLHR